ncbi:MAG: response regulator [Limisphaerales bacterium]
MPRSPTLREREERLESLKLLAGQLAHDFNNFLVPILGYVSLIKEDLGADSPAQQYATALETSARKTENMLDGVLLATRPQRRFRPKLTDFRALVERELDDWTGALPSNARITVTRKLAPCSLVLDEAQWQDAVRQLLRNARFALATGGNLEVALQPHNLTSELAAELGMASTDGFQLVVRDDGFGMAPEVVRRAFEPFFSTRPKNQGLGLGLTIVHSVVRLHGGQVVLESKEDGGTTVNIQIPIAQPEVELPVADGDQGRVAPAPARRPAGSKVLLVDDDPLVLEVIKACLQRAQFDVHVAYDGQAGLKLYKKQPRDWALIITDLAMPVMGGIEMVQQIRQIDPGAEVILVSGDVEASREENIARLGLPQATLIKKPFTLKGLMEAIKPHLDRHSTGSVSRKPCN